MSISRRTFSTVFAALLATPLVGCATKSTDDETVSEGKSYGASDSYDQTLFDTSVVHSIDVTIAEEDWADLLANPLEKTKYQVSVSIDDETVSDVSFATKGNTSLSAVASDEDSNRYSFKINFGKYVDGQTYRGLDKLNLNNVYADATYLKDYLCYQLFGQAGVYAPLCSYIWVSVNGEDLGLYTAIEEVGDSFLARNGIAGTALYKPETQQLANMTGEQNGGQADGGGGGQMPGGSQAQGDGTASDSSAIPGGTTAPDGSTMPDAPSTSGGSAMPDAPSTSDSSAMPDAPSTSGGASGTNEFGGGDFGQQAEGGNAGGQGFSMDSSSNGADLVYTDDTLESYSDIFDNAETDVTEEDERRVIASLMGLSTGEGLSAFLDIDQVIAYFAAHNFVLNYDSYTGTMLHNYYLSESDGRLGMIPWDYNLSFGAFGGQGQASSQNDASQYVNWGIDAPLSGTTADARPMWAWIANDATYLDRYHQVFDELMGSYFESGAYATEIQRVSEMISPFTAQDPSAFYTFEEYEVGVETLESFCGLRAESVRAQLAGSLAADSSLQDTADQVDASSITISDMGSQSMDTRGN